MVCKQCWGLGVRHVQLVLILCVFAVIHVFRVCPLMAIQLAKHEVQDSSSYHEDPFKNTVVNWDETDMAILNDALYFVQPFAYFLGGWMSSKWNNKLILLGTVFLMALQCFSLPSIVRSRAEKVGWAAVMIMRLVVGIMQGVSEPICYQIMGRWTTVRDYCKASTLLVVGSMTGWLLIQGVIYFIGKSVMGWSSIFYTSGNIGVLWCVAWFTFGSKDFRDCFYISSEEKSYMVSYTSDLDNYGLGPKNEKRPPRWKKIFKSKDVYVLLVTSLMTQWAYSAILLPRFVEAYYLNVYLRTDKDMFLETKSFFLFSIGIVTWLLIIGTVADKLVTQKKAISSHQRKTCNSIGFWGQAVTMVCMGFVTTHSATVVWTIVMYLVVSFRSIGMEVAYLEMAPNYAGLIYGTIKSISLVPLTILVLVEDLSNISDLTKEEARSYLFTAALMYYLANFIYCNGFNTKCQEWNKATMAPTNKSISVFL
ncbi:hypothetical protein GE061_002104 [Apolygus lucorum]|uniref:Major facilitator superfamily (MFS) profile domain-containing protein n=1 Tax=Apolygus lucorum TaxID=248454 RepID=A0A6A4JE85_APOLU|nr:hypothetical protein GE061_002104 [Apolygus lucorum]